MWNLERAIKMRKSGMLFKEIAAKFRVSMRTVPNGFEVHAPGLKVPPHVHTKHKFDYRSAMHARSLKLTDKKPHCFLLTKIVPGIVPGILKLRRGMCTITG